jgi:hypothetical protein
MISQRWGTFSVMDLTDPGRLAPELLLYDKLVIPVPATSEDKNRWENEGWRPDDQADFLKMIGSLAIKKKWGYGDQALWAQEFAKLKEDTAEIVKEARESLAYELTRRVLAQQKYPLPLGVERIDVVAACQSEKDFHAQFVMEKASDSRVDLGLKLVQKIAVPFQEDKPKNALERAIELARNPEYCEKRTIVYDLQNKILSDPEPALESMEELEQRTEDLIDYVVLMTKKVRFASTFAIVGVPPGYAAGRPLPKLASGSTMLSAVQFRSRHSAFIGSLVSSGPTTMYHE